jgi:hypothetical protein
VVPVGDVTVTVTAPVYAATVSVLKIVGVIQKEA